MNRLRIIILVGLGISLLYSFVKSIVLRMPGRSLDSARKRMAQAHWLDADSREGALVKMTGKVRTREAGERFVSPLADIRCVALHMRALLRHGRSPRGKLVEKLEIKPFVIEDHDGKVLVDATHALLDQNLAEFSAAVGCPLCFASMCLEEARRAHSVGARQNRV